MNSEKAKRSDSSRQKIILFSAIILVTAILVIAASLFLFNPNPSPVFVTEAWDDPHWICATAFMYEFVPFDEEEFQRFEAAINSLDLNIQLEGISRLQSDNRCVQGGEWQMNFLVSSEQLADEAALGRLIQALMSLPEADPEIFYPTVLHLSFRASGEQQVKSWVFSTEQARRAIEAGVSGEALFSIGREY